LQLRQEIFSSLSSQRLQLARHPRRPSTLDYIQAISDEWIELHGDRRSSDDLALVGGVAVAGRVVMLGHQKGAILRTMSPVTLAWLPAAIAGDAVNGTRQSIWDAHIDLYRHTELRLVKAEHQGQGSDRLQSPRCSGWMFQLSVR